MDFFYTGDYTEEPKEEDIDEDAISILSVYIVIFVLADKYNIEELIVLLVKKYLENLIKNPDISNFLLFISEVYNSILTSLRGLYNYALAFTKEKLFRLLTLLDIKEQFNKVTANISEFI